MSLTVHPDPQERAGGYAFLELPEGSLPGQTATVAVFDSFTERWLAASDGQGAGVGIGNGNWQSDPAQFGPYEVHRHDGADWVRIGPEIVNKLDEYAPLRILIAGTTYDVVWPDDVPPRAGAAVLGGLQATARNVATGNPDHLVGKIQDDPGAEIADEVSDDPEEAVETPPRPSGNGRRLAAAVFLAILLAAALAGWYFWPGDDTGKTGVAGGDGCSHAALAGLGGGFSETAEALRACGTRVSPDTALALLETAAAADDPAALLLFGTLYDGNQLDPRIENLIGLSFEDDPAQAAEYYARAVKVGASEAKSRLSETCKILSASDATLAKGAYDDYCL